MTVIRETVRVSHASESGVDKSCALTELGASRRRWSTTAVGRVFAGVCYCVCFFDNCERASEREKEGTKRRERHRELERRYPYMFFPSFFPNFQRITLHFFYKLIVFVNWGYNCTPMYPVGPVTDRKAQKILIKRN